MSSSEPIDLISDSESTDARENEIYEMLEKARRRRNPLSVFIIYQTGTTVQFYIGCLDEGILDPIILKYKNFIQPITNRQTILDFLNHRRNHVFPVPSDITHYNNDPLGYMFVHISGDLQTAPRIVRDLSNDLTSILVLHTETRVGYYQIKSTKENIKQLAYMSIENSTNTKEEYESFRELLNSSIHYHKLRENFIIFGRITDVFWVTMKDEDFNEYISLEYE
jgi:hypothetical protein